LKQKNHVLTPTLTGIAERKHLSHPNIDLDTHVQDILNTIYYEELRTYKDRTAISMIPFPPKTGIAVLPTCLIAKTSFRLQLILSFSF